MCAGCGCGRAADESANPVTGVGTSLIKEGRIAYGHHCAGCHGVDGDGNGYAAKFLRPKPRNFQLANFKFSSTRAGRLPTDDDLKRTLREGLQGTAMPGWPLLPERTVEALIAYIKTFSPKWKTRPPAPEIAYVNDPYRSLEDPARAVARGEAVYHGFATCWTCHPAYISEDRINEYLILMENDPQDSFRDDLHGSLAAEDTEGELIYPPDFRRDHVRSGAAVDDLYRSIAAGITGTAMPAWIDAMDFPSRHREGPLVTPADLWAMAYYVRSLILSRPSRLDEDDVIVRDRRQVIHLHGEPARPVEQPVAPDDVLDEEFLEGDG